jgi:hypothetical protein
MSTYTEFLAGKRRIAPVVGIDPASMELHPSLFPHQVDVARTAAERGCMAVFLDAGLGKTRIMLTWAQASGARTLIFAPLSVTSQTVREAAAIDLEANYVRSDDQATGPGIWVTNYEMAEHFDPAGFDAVVLDESSILKNHTGARRTKLIERWTQVPRRLACTATPAPNDVTELANHAEFLGAMTRVEMLAAWFVHDDVGWRLKGHASDAMYRWMATWAIAARKPSDLGAFADDAYVLPDLRIHPEIVEHHQAPEGQLFTTNIGGVGARARLRKATMATRLDRAATLLDHDRPAIAWCGLNDEAIGLTAAIDGAVNLHGTLTPERKVEIIEAFVAGEIRVLVTKPAIAGWGMNFQHAAQQVFVGLGDSYEAYYQAIRRSWRFGQRQPVDVHIVVSEPEREITANVARKEDEAAVMTDRLVTAMRAATTSEAAA